MQRKDWYLGLPVVLAFGVSAIALQPGEARAQANELKIAVSTFATETLDAVDGGVGSFSYQLPLYDHLVTLNTRRQMVPGLAESWTVTPDGKIYTFKLRRGVKFHNGDDFSAADVINHFTVRLPKSKQGIFASEIAGLTESMQAPDPMTVVWTLKKADADFFGKLTPSDTTIGGITPKKATDDLGTEKFADMPIGTGPFKIVDRKKGASMHFDRITAHAYRPVPKFEKLRISRIPEEATRVAMLQRGEADIGEVDVEAAKTVVGHGGQVFEIPNAYVAFISFIGAWEQKAKDNKVPAADVRVRKALAMAINRQELLDIMLDKRGQLINAFLTFQGGLGYDEAWEKANGTAFDPAGAKRLLAEAGYPNGFKQKLWAMPLAGAPWFPKATEVIADYWRAIGVEVTFQQTDFGALGPQIYSRAEGALGDAYNLRTGRTDFAIGKLNNYMTTDGRNKVANINWNTEWNAANDVLDPKAREAAFQKLARDFRETYTLIPLFNTGALYGARRDIEGWEPTQGWPNISMRYEYLGRRS